MGKLSKTLTILGGTVLAGFAYSLWKDKKDLEDGIMVSENENLEEDIFQSLEKVVVKINKCTKITTTFLFSKNS